MTNKLNKENNTGISSCGDNGGIAMHYVTMSNCANSILRASQMVFN